MNCITEPNICCFEKKKQYIVKFKVSCNIILKMCDDYNFNSPNILYLYSTSHSPGHLFETQIFCILKSFSFVNFPKNTANKPYSPERHRHSLSILFLNPAFTSDSINNTIPSFFCTREQYENDHLFCFVIFLSRLLGYLNS